MLKNLFGGFGHMVMKEYKQISAFSHSKERFSVRTKKLHGIRMRELARFSSFFGASGHLFLMGLDVCFVNCKIRSYGSVSLDVTT